MAADIKQAIRQFKADIRAIKKGQADPTRLQAFAAAADYLGQTRFSQSATKGGQAMNITSNGVTVNVGADTNKCNFFIAAVYVLGANMGFGTSTNPTGYQYNYHWRAGGPLTGAYDLPGAEEISNSGMSNFQQTTAAKARLGDVVTGASPEGYYHAGIQLYCDHVISANTEVGVRTGSMGYTGATRKYHTLKQ